MKQIDHLLKQVSALNAKVSVLVQCTWSIWCKVMLVICVGQV